MIKRKFKAISQLVGLLAHYACMRFQFRSGVWNQSPAQLLQQSAQRCACQNSCSSH